MAEIIKLKNGITLISEEKKDVESVCMKILVKTGARNENINNNGISHFLEHMAFKGTEKRDAKKIAYDFENIGASFNAYTSKETTGYYAKVLKNYVTDSLEILVDMFENSIFLQEELEKERNVILQELAMTKDLPDDMIYEYFMETAFANQAIGRTILGPKKNIKKFQKKDFLNYINNNYLPENIVLSVCGNISFREITKIANDIFNKTNNGKQNPIELAKYTGGYYKKIKKDLEQFQCILGFDCCSYNDKDFYNISVGNFIFGASVSSRLFQEIRENKGLCYSVTSYNASYSDCGAFMIYLGTDPNKINDAIDGVFSEINKFVGKGITDEELKRAKIKIKSSLLMSNESVSSITGNNANNYLKFNRIISLQELSDSVENVTKDDIIRSFRNIISSKPTVALYGSNNKVYDYETILLKL